MSITMKKIVFRMSMEDEKSRSKALKISVSILVKYKIGVESVAVKGDQVEVIGEGIDAVELIRRLRKSMLHAELISVGEVNNQGNTTAAKTVVLEPQAQVVWMQPYAPVQSYDGYSYSYSSYTHPAHFTEPGCIIM